MYLRPRTARTLLTGTMAFFFPLCLRSTRDIRSGSSLSSSLSSSAMLVITCRDTRACRALEVAIQETIIGHFFPLACVAQLVDLTGLEGSVSPFNFFPRAGLICACPMLMCYAMY